MMKSPTPRPSNPAETAMNISLMVGVVMLGAKWWAYLLTGSVVIFSDAAESIVHVLAVTFAWRALRISRRPPDDDHHFGHDKISFVSAGTEGVLISLAAITIVVTAVQRLVTAEEIHNFSTGVSITAAAGAINALLGVYLVRVGRVEGQIAVVANGKHVLTDAWTSAGAVAGLAVAWWSGIFWLDPVIAILFAINIVREGVKLLSVSLDGLMDKTNLVLEEQAKSLLTEFCNSNGCSYHRFRLRESAERIHVDFHFTVPDTTTIVVAHGLASRAEEHLKEHLRVPIDLMTHIEPTSLPPDHV